MLGSMSCLFCLPLLIALKLRYSYDVEAVIIHTDLFGWLFYLLLLSSCLTCTDFILKNIACLIWRSKLKLGFSYHKTFMFTSLYFFHIWSSILDLYSYFSLHASFSLSITLLLYISVCVQVIHFPTHCVAVAYEFESKSKSVSRKLPRKRKVSKVEKEAADNGPMLLLQHRHAALNRVKDLIDCSHLEINWHLNLM